MTNTFYMSFTELETFVTYEDLADMFKEDMDEELGGVDIFGKQYNRTVVLEKFEPARFQREVLKWAVDADYRAFTLTDEDVQYLITGKKEFTVRVFEPVMIVIDYYSADGSWNQISTD